MYMHIYYFLLIIIIFYGSIISHVSANTHCKKYSSIIYIVRNFFAISPVEKFFILKFDFESFSYIWCVLDIIFRVVKKKKKKKKKCVQK